MAIHAQRTPSADTMSYANYPKFFEIFKGDFTAVQMEKKKIFAHISLFNRLAPVDKIVVFVNTRFINSAQL
jgi:hypothetical protein